MKITKLHFLLFFLSLSSISLSQFSIDVYSGYNHSKKEFTLPHSFDSSKIITYFSGNICDTIYNPVGYEDSILLVYEQIVVVNEYGCQINHNFASSYIYGLNVQYAYEKYFATGISFEKHGFIRDASSIQSNQTRERYSNDCMCEDSLIYSVYLDEMLNYSVISTSLTQSFFYPFKRVRFFADIGVSAYYTLMDYEFNGQYTSLYHPIYDSRNIYDNTSKIVKRYEGYSFGYKFAIGISYNLSSNISIFGSVGYTKANLNIRKGTFISEDPVPSDLSYYDPDYVAPVYPHELSPDEIPFKTIDYDSWNFRLGLRYTFGKKSEE